MGKGSEKNHVERIQNSDTRTNKKYNCSKGAKTKGNKKQGKVKRKEETVEKECRRQSEFQGVNKNKQGRNSTQNIKKRTLPLMH